MPRKNTTQRKPRLRLVTPAAPPPASDTMDCFVPAGYREGDITLAMVVSDNTFSHVGLYEGDVALLLKTQDVTPDDVAAVEIDGETWLGKYRPAPGGYFTFEQDGDVDRFKPGTALLVGRVCHYERKGEIIRKFRPVR